MKEIIKNSCDMILANREALKKSMFWELDSNTYAIMGGILTTAKGMTADAAEYKACKKIIRKNISAFSTIRGYSEAITAVKMMAVEDKVAYIKGVEAVYKKLRQIHKLTASPYMIMAATNIYEAKGTEQADAEIDKLEKLYKGLKEMHPFLISDSDRGYLSMLVEMDVDVYAVLDNIEKNYERCKKITIDKNSVYSMAQVLALSKKEPEENCEFVQKVLAGLKANGNPISKEYGLTVIGALSLLNMDADQVIADISDAYAYLKGHKGFRWYNQGRRLNATYAALAVYIANSKASGMSDTISSNITVAIAEEIILLIIIVIMTSISSSSSSSGSGSN